MQGAILLVTFGVITARIQALRLTANRDLRLRKGNFDDSADEQLRFVHPVFEILRRQADQDTYSSHGMTEGEIGVTDQSNEKLSVSALAYSDAPDFEPLSLPPVPKIEKQDEVFTPRGDQVQPPPPKKKEARSISDHYNDVLPDPKTSKGDEGHDLLVDIYVINLRTREDRWHCIESQLLAAHTPFNYTRFPAVHGKETGKACPYLKWDIYKDNPAAAGLMCSNYLIWQDAIGKSAKWIIILEDDVALSKDIWRKVTDLLTGNCKGAFDYAAVDTFQGFGDSRRKAWPPSGEDRRKMCIGAIPGVNIHALSGSGTQMQIIHRDSLENMIRLAEERPELPVDRLNHKMGYHGLRTVMFQAEIAAQFQSARKQGVDKPSKEMCSKSVERADISM